MSLRQNPEAASLAILLAAACGGKSVASNHLGDLGGVVAGNGGSGGSSADAGGEAGSAAGGTASVPPKSGCEPPRRGRISGTIDGVRVETPGEVFSGGSGVSSSERWSLAWSLAAFGTAYAWGRGPAEVATRGEAFLALPRAGDFDGGVYMATAELIRREPDFDSVAFSALRRVGRCPGEPWAGELTFCAQDYGCAPGAEDLGNGSLRGTLAGGEFFHGLLVSTVRGGDDWLHFSGEGGLVAVRGTETGGAGVYVGSLPSSFTEILCFDALKERPRENGSFTATAISYAGSRPGEPVSGELLIEPCEP